MTQDIQVHGGFTITKAQIDEQIKYSRDVNHAACFFQLVMIPYPGEEIPVFPVMTVRDLFDEERPTLSVTNDAEFVTMRAWNYAKNQQYATVPDTIPIIYCDTEGRWDELRHRMGNFACFRSLDTDDMDLAIEKVQALWQKERKTTKNH